MFTLNDFIRELKPCSNLGRLLGDDSLMGRTGLVFRDSYWIETSDAAEDRIDGEGRPRFYTITTREEYQSNDLKKVAGPLLEYIKGEHEDLCPELPFLNALEVFARAGQALTVAWETVEGSATHPEIPIVGYPFDKSFDEVVGDLFEWEHKVKERWGI